jgi:hypothetical protein
MAAAATRIVRQQKLRDRLFTGVFPAGISYCDRAEQEDGDYRKIAFLDYETLELTVYDHASDLLPLIRLDANAIQNRRGQRYRVSASGQTVLLGGSAAVSELRLGAEVVVDRQYSDGRDIPFIRVRTAQGEFHFVPWSSESPDLTLRLTKAITDTINAHMNLAKELF